MQIKLVIIEIILVNLNKIYVYYYKNRSNLDIKFNNIDKFKNTSSPNQ
jgi:hypothetical protein